MVFGLLYFLFECLLKKLQHKYITKSTKLHMPLRTSSLKNIPKGYWNVQAALSYFISLPFETGPSLSCKQNSLLIFSAIFSLRFELQDIFFFSIQIKSNFLFLITLVRHPFVIKIKNHIITIFNIITFNIHIPLCDLAVA